MEYLADHKLSISLADLYAEIEHKGWTVKSVKFDSKNNRYVAQGQDADKKAISVAGSSVQYALAHLLQAVTEQNSLRVIKQANWSHNFESQLVEIAQAYSKAPAYEKRAATAFVELAHECKARADVIRQHLHVIISNEAEPYTQPDQMYDSIRKQRKLEVSAVSADQHPIWDRQQVVDYRICLDVLGFTAANADWGWTGTNLAFAAMAEFFPELAQEALFSELLGQTAYATYYRAYSPSKVCLLNKFLEPIRQQENPYKGYRGIHPSQMPLPSEIPAAKDNRLSHIAKRIEPLQDGTLSADINDGWSSGLEQTPLIHYPTQYPDFLNLRGVSEALDGLHTDWADHIHDDSDASKVRQEWRAYKQDDPQGAMRMQHAVANAIKAALFMQSEPLAHAAIHYQSLLHTVSDDPEDLWRQLHQSRSEWNTQRFGQHTKNEHRPWLMPDAKTGVSPFTALANLLYAQGADSPQEATKAAHRKVHQMLSRLHEQAKSESNPDQETHWQIEQKAIDNLMRWLDLSTKNHTQFDRFKARTSADTDPIAPHKYDKDYDAYENHKIFNLQRYPAPHGRDVQTMAKLMRHLDQITEAALVDIHNHDGKGHHFRVVVMHLADLDPKTVGLMWLLLAPYTSQLSMIDESMRGALGHHSDGKAARDYFLHERELLTHRDGMGLSHIPLGHFNLAVNGSLPMPQTKESAIHNVPQQQDLSAFRVENPTPAWQVPWHFENEHPNYDFALTKDLAQMAQDEWRNTVATQFAPHQTPVKPQSPTFVMAATKTASRMQRYRDLGLDVEDVWQQVPEIEEIAPEISRNDF